MNSGQGKKKIPNNEARVEVTCRRHTQETACKKRVVATGVYVKKDPYQHRLLQEDWMHNCELFREDRYEEHCARAVGTGEYVKTPIDVESREGCMRRRMANRHSTPEGITYTSNIFRMHYGSYEEGSFCCENAIVVETIHDAMCKLSYQARKTDISDEEIESQLEVVRYMAKILLAYNHECIFYRMLHHFSISEEDGRRWHYSTEEMSAEKFPFLKCIKMPNVGHAPLYMHSFGVFIGIGVSPLDGTDKFMMFHTNKEPSIIDVDFINDMNDAEKVSFATILAIISASYTLKKSNSQIVALANITPTMMRKGWGMPSRAIFTTYNTNGALIYEPMKMFLGTLGEEIALVHKFRGQVDRKYFCMNIFNMVSVKERFIPFSMNLSDTALTQFMRNMIK